MRRENLVKQSRISPITLGVGFLVFAAICLLIGSFLDYQISKS
jgi:hypothetical protein